MTTRPSPITNPSFQNSLNTSSNSSLDKLKEGNSLTPEAKITDLPFEILCDILSRIPVGDRTKNCELVSRQFMSAVRGLYQHECNKLTKDAPEEINYPETKQRVLMHKYGEKYGKKTPVQIKNANDLHRNLTEAKTFEKFVKAFAQAGFVPNQKSEKMDKGDLKSLEDAYHHREWLKEKNNFLFFMCFIPFEKLKDHFISTSVENFVFSPLYRVLERGILPKNTTIQIELAYAMLTAPINQVNLNVNQKDWRGWNALSFAITCIESFSEDAVQIRNKGIKIIQRLLSEHGAEIGQDLSLSSIFYILKLMCINNDKEGVALFVKKMVSSGRVDADCLSYICKFSSHGSIYISPIIKSLIENSAGENNHSIQRNLLDALIKNGKAKDIEYFIEISEKVSKNDRATISEKQIGKLIERGCSEKIVDQREPFFKIVNDLLEKDYATDDIIDEKKTKLIQLTVDNAYFVKSLHNSQLLSILHHLFENYMELQKTPWQASASPDSGATYKKNKFLMMHLLSEIIDDQGDTLIHHAVDKGDVNLLHSFLEFFQWSDNFKKELFNLKNKKDETPYGRVSSFTAEKIKSIGKESYDQMIEVLLFTDAQFSLDFRTTLECVKAAKKAENGQLCLRISLEYLKHSIVNAVEFALYICALPSLIVSALLAYLFIWLIENHNPFTSNQASST